MVNFYCCFNFPNPKEPAGKDTSQVLKKVFYEHPNSDDAKMARHFNGFLLAQQVAHTLAHTIRTQ